MELYVIRHARAENEAADGIDAHRRLTADGARRLREVRRGLARQGVTFARLLHSPWARAAETAGELARLLAEGEPRATSLLCGAPGADLVALLAADPVTTALVGHQPWLGALIGWLAFGDPRRGEGLELKKGAVARLVGEPAPGAMRLVALMPPRALRALGA